MKTNLGVLFGALSLCLAVAACESGTTSDDGGPVATFSAGLLMAEDGLAEIEHGMQQGARDPMWSGMSDLHAGRDEMNRAMQAMMATGGCACGSARDAACGGAGGYWQAGLPDMDAGLSALETTMAQMGGLPTDADREHMGRGLDLCRQALDRMRAGYSGLSADSCGCRMMQGWGDGMDADAGATGGSWSHGGTMDDDDDGDWHGGGMMGGHR